MASKITAVLHYQKDTKQYRQFTLDKDETKNKVVGSVYFSAKGMFKDADVVKVTFEPVKD